MVFFSTYPSLTHSSTKHRKYPSIAIRNVYVIFRAKFQFTLGYQRGRLVVFPLILEKLYSVLYERELIRCRFILTVIITVKICFFDLIEKQFMFVFSIIQHSANLAFYLSGRYNKVFFIFFFWTIGNQFRIVVSYGKKVFFSVCWFMNNIFECW